MAALRGSAPYATSLRRAVQFACALLTLVGVAGRASSQTPGEVAVLFEQESKVHRLTFDRFHELSQQGGRGGAEAVPYALEAGLANAADVISKIQARRPKLVFAIGTSAAKLAGEKLRDVPILYSMVLNPGKHDLARANQCGISLEISPKDQLASFLKLKPAAKRIAVIFDPSSSDRTVEEADAFARTAGFELVKKKATSVKESLVAIKELENEPLDAFLMILDPVITNEVSFKVLLTFSLKKRLALIVPADPFVKAGALLSVGPDYNKIADQAWEIARRLLQGDAKPSDIGLRRPEATVTAVNNTIAKALGLEIPRTFKIDITY